MAIFIFETRNLWEQ